MGFRQTLPSLAGRRVRLLRLVKMQDRRLTVSIVFMDAEQQSWWRQARLRVRSKRFLVAILAVIIWGVITFLLEEGLLHLGASQGWAEWPTRILRYVGLFSLIGWVARSEPKRRA